MPNPAVPIWLQGVPIDLALDMLSDRTDITPVITEGEADERNR